MKIAEVIRYLNEAVPLSYQEDYDNSGLQTGETDIEVTSALLTLDITEKVLDEAIRRGSNLIISHHPLIYTPLRQISDDTATGRILLKAIRGGITIYSAHTNLDNLHGGVTWKMAEKLGMVHLKPLDPLKGSLLKLITFIPGSHFEMVRSALFAAGAGEIGRYDMCSFSSGGEGSFRAGEDANPFVGSIGKLHLEEEIRLEVVLHAHLKGAVIKALMESHPYEEAAYDIYKLENLSGLNGMGVIGNLSSKVNSEQFLTKLTEAFGCEVIRFAGSAGSDIFKVALCGGSGSFLIDAARKQGAEAFVTGDIKYHSWFEASETLLIADIGHYESEKFATEIIYDLLIKKFPKFAVLFSELNTNPINYFQKWKK